jgi:hypothetical protein
VPISAGWDELAGCELTAATDDTSAIILACAQASRDTDAGAIRRLAAGVTDWQHVREAASAHALLPLLIARLHQSGAEVPPALGEEAEAVVARTLTLIASLVRVRGLLVDAGIDAIAFKGPALSVALYGDPALRQSADIDLLVRRRQALAARRVLEAADHKFWLDLTQGEEARFLRYSNEYGLWDPDGGIVELSWSLAPRHLALQLDADRFFADAVTLQVGGTAFSVLAPHDQLLALAVHGGKHLWERLGWLTDIAQLLGSTPDLDVGVALGRARAVGAERHVLVAGAMCENLLRTELPSPLSNAIGGDSAVPRLVAALRERLLPLTRRNPDRVFEPLSLRLRERRSDRARMVMRLLWTPTVEDWQWVRLPETLAFAYPAVRPFRLAKKYLFS